jgi:hypothetical protein
MGVHSFTRKIILPKAKSKKKNIFDLLPLLWQEEGAGEERFQCTTAIFLTSRISPACTTARNTAS